ncbi:MAG: hypothetical protein A2X98_05005 [Deltaproteobacteria bacterium GWC2_66_88]|nr:MAG: hypothetical protein A2X98_05005 [Deltaproteobacteria bacterium GWC2_66_88]
MQETIRFRLISDAMRGATGEEAAPGSAASSTLTVMWSFPSAFRSRSTWYSLPIRPIRARTSSTWPG